MEERKVKFEGNKQKLFLSNIIEDEKSLKDFHNKNSKRLKVSYSALKQYARGDRLLSERLLRDICEMKKIPYPEKDLSYLPSTWGASKGGKLGMATLQRKYSDKLNLWRSKGGKASGISWNTKKIKIPELDEDLAEFIGICLGDGTLTEYFLRIFGNLKYDVPHLEYISKRIQTLFGITPRLRIRNNLLILETSSKKMCQFLHEEYGLPYGSKITNKAAIPPGIIENRKLSLACLRGLMDTDGGVCKRGNQISLNFTSRDSTLLEQAWNIGKPFFSYNDGEDVGTNSFKKIIEYFKVVGSSNLKNIVCFSERYKNNKYLYRREGVEYYSRYGGVSLPYKLRADGLVGQDTVKDNLAA